MVVRSRFGAPRVGAGVTELSYLENGDAAYIREFEARIQALPPGAVVLDRTYFYPTGGGQPADRGTLTRSAGNAWPVTDVSRSGPAVLHRITRSGRDVGALQIGDSVHGSIDWERRYRFMRAHTGQHLLSAQLWERYGRRTIRARLTESGGELVLEGASVLPELDGFVGDVNTLLRSDRPVQVRMIPRAEYDQSPAGRSSLVPLPAGLATVRVIEIESADRCPCGGTHVRRLGEVGSLAVTGTVAESGGTLRVGFRLEGLPTSTPTG